jgi:hypothetical protein
MAIAASPVTAVGMAGRANLGTATTRTPTPTISRSSSGTSTSRTQSMSAIRPEAARWRAIFGRHGNERVAKAALIGAIPPVMIKSEKNPGGTPIEAFDQLRAAVQADRSQFWKDLSLPFYGYNKPGAKVSEGVRESVWLQGMMAGLPATYLCIKAFSETDLTEDLKKFSVPTLILHGLRGPDRTDRGLSCSVREDRQERDPQGLRGRAARHVHDPQGSSERRATRLHQGLSFPLASCSADAGWRRHSRTTFAMTIQAQAATIFPSRRIS